MDPGAVAGASGNVSHLWCSTVQLAWLPLGLVLTLGVAKSLGSLFGTGRWCYLETYCENLREIDHLQGCRLVLEVVEYTSSSFFSRPDTQCLRLVLVGKG